MACESRILGTVVSHVDKLCRPFFLLIKCNLNRYLIDGVKNFEACYTHGNVWDVVE